MDFDGYGQRPGPALAEDADEQGWLEADVPGDVHRALLNAGRIEDPYYGVNSLRCRWTEEKYWVFRRQFDLADGDLAPGNRVHIVFDGLDIDATVAVNGEAVGSHRNAFRPFRADITQHVRAGKNVVAVQLDAGLFAVADKPASEYQSHACEQLTKRWHLRRPQFSAQWDWAPRLLNCGIWRDVRIEIVSAVALDTVWPVVALQDDHRSAKVTLRALVRNVTEQELNVTLAAELEGAGMVAEGSCSVPAGESVQELSFEIPEPELWWPAGHGERHLYGARVELRADDALQDSRPVNFGVRSISIDRSPHPDCGEHFALVVNGRKIFAKGGNWVPADMLYGETSAERYRELVALAADANFNLLRIWGGGLYESHDFFDACDELGIMVWHDFIFACSKYPGGDPDFLEEIRAEATHVVRDLAGHPSLCVWCGNNEIEWGMHDWGYGTSFRCIPDHHIYHILLPKIVRAEDGTRPYWPSSPYSPDALPPNDPTIGDQHPWGVSLGADGPDFWQYRNYVDRFPNEGGVLGASVAPTLKEMMPKDEHYVGSWSWRHHDNTMCHAGAGGATDNLLKHWLGIERPHELSLDEYAFLSGVLHCEGLCEYIDNYRRRQFSSSSAVFWMYNDTWPCSTSWSIVDWYLRLKMAYHPVRRAFAPIHVVVADLGETVGVFGVNDSPAGWRGRVQYGLAMLDGGPAPSATESATIEPGASCLLGEIDRAEWNRAGEDLAVAYGALLDEEGALVAQNRLFVVPFKDLRWADPVIRVTQVDGFAEFASSAFAWRVCVDLDGRREIPDNAFDLIPGIAYRIRWPDRLGSPAVAQTGNLSVRQGRGGGGQEG